MICRHYMFDDKSCIEDDLSCGSDEVPESKEQCRNKLYQPFLLPEGYSDLVMEELRGKNWCKARK